LVRWKYIEHGQGKPEDVLETFIKYKRAKKVEKALDNSKLGSIVECPPYRWMRRSKRCKEFVADVAAGLPSDKEIEALVEVVEKKWERKGDGGQQKEDESDDERSSYRGRNYSCGGYDYCYDCYDYDSADDYWQ
jgi:hypothetical protein